VAGGLLDRPGIIEEEALPLHADQFQRVRLILIDSSVKIICHRQKRRTVRPVTPEPGRIFRLP